MRNGVSNNRGFIGAGPWGSQQCVAFRGNMSAAGEYLFYQMGHNDLGFPATGSSTNPSYGAISYSFTEKAVIGYANGVTKVRANGFQPLTVADQYTTDGYSLIGVTNNLTEYLNGVLYALAVYESPLSLAEVQTWNALV